MTPFRIDVHHHAVPDMYVNEMNRQGYVPSHGRGFPKWSPQASLDTMDQFGIAAAVTSVSSPGVYLGDAQQSVRLARQLNEYSAKTTQQYPNRLGFFAILPMPLTEPSIREAVHALDELGADGVVLLASAGGRFLGDPDFEELMAELDKRRCVVFIHPNIHSTSEQLPLDIPGFYLEFMFDTTRAVANLIYSGTLERYQQIRWIVAHAGATVPYLAWRIALANTEPRYLDNAPRGALAYLKSLYYDTALSPTRFTMGSLLQLVEPTQILFGSDFPFAPELLVGVQVQELDENPLFDDATRRMVLRDNALRLFPRFRLPGEVPSDMTAHRLLEHRKIPTAKRFAMKVLRKLVDN